MLDPKCYSTQHLTAPEVACPRSDTSRPPTSTDIRPSPSENNHADWQTDDGIVLHPIYTRATAAASSSLIPDRDFLLRGVTKELGTALAVDLRQRHAHPDPEMTNRAVLDDLQGGVSSLELRLDRAVRSGSWQAFCPQGDVANESPSDATRGNGWLGDDGVMLYQVSDFDTALASVPLDQTAISLDAGNGFLAAAALLAALWERRGVDPIEARGAFGGDPIGTLSRAPSLVRLRGKSMHGLADLATWTSRTFPHVTSATVDSTTYYDAGGTDTQELAFSIATAVEYLRAMTVARNPQTETLSIDQAAAQLLFRYSLGTDHFLSVAKLRAARVLWARVLQTCGGSPLPMKMQTCTSSRVMTDRDLNLNLLRNCTAVFSGLLGGADTVTSLPLDHAIGLPDEFGRRMARNTVLILNDEAKLGRVADPAGGSYFFETLTDQLCEQAWALFQQVERRGGMLACVRNGWVAKQIIPSAEKWASQFAYGEKSFVGVTKFIHARSRIVRRAAPDVDRLRQFAIHQFAAHRDAQIAIPLLEHGPNLAEAMFVEAQGGASIPQMNRMLGDRVSREASP
ncbi:methylmalonyl-CoA mutase family protein [Novipirellula maiorica]|nr:methylmalonyl-CoA mutase family protein [Rhodopirellula maiorica]